jgi:hypothetical protein
MTNKTSQLDVAEVLRDPKAFFSEPQDVVVHPHLSREDKLAILRRWEADALRLSASESEGMGGGEESMLGRVETAIGAIATMS